MKILFPSEPFALRIVDSSFKAEYDASKLVGFDSFLFDHDEYVKTSILKTTLPFREGHPEPIMLRSWMLNEWQYKSFYTALLAQGYQLINGPTQYLNAHHFPNVYKLIEDNTAKAWWTERWADIEDTDKTDWKSVRDYLGGDVIIKDYVKSEKGNPDLFMLSKDLSNQEFYEKILKFIDARGKLFNAGIVLKQVENLKKYDGNTNEWRFFLIDGEPLVMEFNGVQGTNTKMPSLAITLECCEIAKKIDSRFITIDIAEKEDESWMILEAGDGQVSGMPTETMAIAFYNKLKNDFKFGIE